MSAAEQLKRLPPHPNVVRLHECFQAGGVPVLVLERVHGQPLDVVLREQGPFSAEEAVRIVSEVLDALEHVHQHKLVHRDVKPENVMLRPDGQIKLIDFGIALATEGTQHTVAGTLSVMGTRPYMAPEQWLVGQATALSDVYGAGRLLFALLAGRPPRIHADGLGVQRETLREALELPDIGLVDIQDRATLDRPSERFPSAAAFREALLAWRPTPREAVSLEQVLDHAAHLLAGRPPAGAHPLLDVLDRAADLCAKRDREPLAEVLGFVAALSARGDDVPSAILRAAVLRFGTEFFPDQHAVGRAAAPVTLDCARHHAFAVSNRELLVSDTEPVLLLRSVFCVSSEAGGAEVGLRLVSELSEGHAPAAPATWSGEAQPGQWLLGGENPDAAALEVEDQRRCRVAPWSWTLQARVGEGLWESVAAFALGVPGELGQVAWLSPAAKLEGWSIGSTDYPTPSRSGKTLRLRVAQGGVELGIEVQVAWKRPDRRSRERTKWVVRPVAEPELLIEALARVSETAPRPYHQDHGCVFVMVSHNDGTTAQYLAPQGPLERVGLGFAQRPGAKELDWAPILWTVGQCSIELQSVAVDGVEGLSDELRANAELMEEIDNIFRAIGLKGAVEGIFDGSSGTPLDSELVQPNVATTAALSNSSLENQRLVLPRPLRAGAPCARYQHGRVSLSLIIDVPAAADGKGVASPLGWWGQVHDTFESPNPEDDQYDDAHCTGDYEVVAFITWQPHIAGSWRVDTVVDLSTDELDDSPDKVNGPMAAGLAAEGRLAWPLELPDLYYEKPAHWLLPRLRKCKARLAEEGIVLRIWNASSFGVPFE